MVGRCVPLLETLHAPAGVCKGLQEVNAPTNRPGAGTHRPTGPGPAGSGRRAQPPHTAALAPAPPRGCPSGHPRTEASPYQARGGRAAACPARGDAGGVGQGHPRLPHPLQGCNPLGGGPLMAWCANCGPVPTSDCDSVHGQLRCLSCRAIVSSIPLNRVQTSTAERASPSRNDAGVHDPHHHRTQPPTAGERNVDPEGMGASAISGAVRGMTRRVSGGVLHETRYRGATRDATGPGRGPAASRVPTARDASPPARAPRRAA
jgi:hypothetical protein